MTYQQIIAALKEQKIKLGYSSTDITKLTGFNSAQINAWINGKGGITLSRLIRLAEALDMKIKIEIL